MSIPGYRTLRASCVPNMVLRIGLTVSKVGGVRSEWLGHDEIADYNSFNMQFRTIIAYLARLWAYYKVVIVG